MVRAMPCHPWPVLRLLRVHSWALSARPQARLASIGSTAALMHHRSYASLRGAAGVQCCSPIWQSSAIHSASGSFSRRYSAV